MFLPHSDPFSPSSSYVLNIAQDQTQEVYVEKFGPINAQGDIGPAEKCGRIQINDILVGLEGNGAVIFSLVSALFEPMSI